MAFLHLGTMSVEVGTILLAGNFGRIIQHPMRSKDQSYRREIALEAYRLEKMPYKPSRLASIFAFEGEAALARYRNIGSGTNNFSILYEIEPISSSAPMHVGCWLLGQLDAGRLDLVPQYWAGLRVDLPQALDVSEPLKASDGEAEIVIGGNCRVVRRLD
ncbi:hypothetical protein [Azorhizobium caulinodans]|uniref:hypothetical protein n=1 Tax=Azorhizobium caulinodans TaxID=7 RepID=UPI002FBD67EF